MLILARRTPSRDTPIPPASTPAREDPAGGPGPHTGSPSAGAHLRVGPGTLILTPHLYK
ncbi:hypothetical protein Acsp01_06090 [Actinoplanes sp. NBRC 101535]|nr:hypothetical protein Acsp01_06090 [Actinoplanes sp. NBRC 101535]